MPIFEFKCLKCNDIFEFLMINSDDQQEMKCPKCKGEELERVLSTSNFAMADGGGNGGADTSVSTTSRSCGGGNCTNWTLPGHTK